MNVKHYRIKRPMLFLWYCKVLVKILFKWYLNDNSKGDKIIYSWREARHIQNLHDTCKWFAVEINWEDKGDLPSLIHVTYFKLHTKVAKCCYLEAFSMDWQKNAKWCWHMIRHVKQPHSNLRMLLCTVSLVRLLYGNAQPVWLTQQTCILSQF